MLERKDQILTKENGFSLFCQKKKGWAEYFCYNVGELCEH